MKVSFISLFITIHAIIYNIRVIMLKSCLSFSYKTTTTRRPGQSQHFRTLLEAASARKTSYRSRNYTNSRRTLTENSSFATSIMPKRKKGSKFYAVAAGREIGIFSTWDECQSQVKGYSNARFKSFSTVEEAESFIGSAPKSSTATEIETYSKMAASMKQKRPRVVAAKNPEGATPGSAKNPIQIERPSPSAAKYRATSSATSKSNCNNTNDSDGVSSNQPNDKEAKGKNLTANKKHPHKLWFHVMFDGGSRGNPHGDAGSGTYILTRKFYNSDSKSKTKTTNTEITRSTTNIRTYLGLGLLTNNQAEYTGLVNGLKGLSVALEETNTSDANKYLQDVIILIQGDSDLIVKQMNGIYACKSPKLKSFYQQSKSLVVAIKKRCKTLGVTCDITFQHVYRENNTIADGLANEAMDAKRSWMTSKGDDENNNSNDESEDAATEV
jgi:ribonuclease HI